MKKILFATTALVATASVAAADVNVGGWGYLGVLKDNDGTSVTHGARVTFSASVETDGGVTFTASSRITTTDDVDKGQLGHNKITVESGDFKLAAGATHGAMKTLARTVAFYGFDDGSLFYANDRGGVDSDLGLGDGGNNILATYSNSGFTVGLASDVDGTTTEIAGQYNVGSLSLGLGLNDNSDWQASAAYGAGDLNVGLGINSDDDIVLTAGYDVAAATSLGFAAEKNTAGNIFGVQVAHDLGGATLSVAASQQENGDNVAALGVQFNF